MVSVIIPVYNGKQFVGEAVKSVLDQTFQNFEIIIIDDGSTDGTRQTIEKLSDKRIRYFYQSNAGIGAARNRGVEESTGELLAFLDADDRWTLNKLERQINELNENTDLEAIFGQARQVLEDKWQSKILETNVPAGELFDAFVPGTMLIRRESFLRVGYFSTEFTIGETVEWYLRAQDQGLQIKLIPELMLCRRIHKTNTGIRHRSSIGDYVKIVKQSIDRRRVAAQEK